MKNVLFFIGVLLLIPFQALADENSGWTYGSNGWQWENPNTGSYLWVGLRFQPRYSNRATKPLSPEDLRMDGEKDFGANRARYKIGGAIGRKFSIYHEYDLKNGRVLDLRATWKPSPLFHLRAGQWKSEFSRERIDSSGKQQFAERSIANYWFTIDRQNGVMASGRFAPGSKGDSSWWFGVLQGGGRGASGDGGRPLVMGRYQWNFTKNVLPFSQSALKRYEEVHSGLSFAIVSNDSPYTRFSSSGGGNLPGYEKGLDNQYRILQFMQEFAWQRGGWSIQQEFHLKEINDRLNSTDTRLRGGYVQAGWFPSSAMPVGQKNWKSQPGSVSLTRISMKWPLTAKN
jgi:phosphate-selective porin OprO/OprP